MTDLPHYLYTLLIKRLFTQYSKIPFFIQIARLNKPIGFYLLLWPTLWGLWFAAEGFPGWHLLSVFVLGTLLTRSAGCIINDIFDRHFDGQVKRTAGRPLAQGQLTIAEALMFMTLLLFFALGLVLTTNSLTLILAFLAALVAAIYPLMKRYTYMPQVILGFAFSFGIPMAFAATQNTIPLLAGVLLMANVVWTVAYDTQYAMVDRDDDLQVGIKSTAILFGNMDKIMIGILQGLFLTMMLMVVSLTKLNWPYYVGISLATGLFIYQQWLIAPRERDDCLTAFLNNHWVGLIIFIGILTHFWIN